MAGNRPDEQQRTAPLDLDREGDSIEERLIDEGESSQRSIVTAAQEGFVRDQDDPEHPTRRRREHDVEDPSHAPRSRGSGAGEGGHDPR